MTISNRYSFSLFIICVHYLSSLRSDAFTTAVTSLTENDTSSSSSSITVDFKTTQPSVTDSMTVWAHNISTDALTTVMSVTVTEYDNDSSSSMNGGDFTATTMQQSVTSSITVLSDNTMTDALTTELELLNMTNIDYNVTDFTQETTTVSPTDATTEFLLNTSSAYDTFWVKTVIEVVDTTINVASSTFLSTLEYRLATVYSLAIEGPTTGTRSNNNRRKRATTYHNATIQMTNTTRESSKLVNTDLIYFLAQYDVDGNMTLTPAAETCSLMKLVPTQQVAIMLGYVVVLQCESYIPPPPSYLWVIGVVIGGFFGLLLLVWCILFTYFKCTRPSRYVKHTNQLRPAATDNMPDIVPEAVVHVDCAVMTEVDAISNSDEKVETTSQQKRKKPRKRKQKSTTTATTTTTTTTIDRQTSVDFPNDSRQDIDSSDAMEQSEQFSVDSMTLPMSVKPVPVHTPLYINTSGSRRLVEPWNPYLAGDMSAAILHQYTQAHHTAPSNDVTGTDVVPDADVTVRSLNSRALTMRSDITNTSSFPHNTTGVSPDTTAAWNTATHSSLPSLRDSGKQYRPTADEIAVINRLQSSRRLAWSRDCSTDQLDVEFVDGRRLREMESDKISELIRHEYELLQATPGSRNITGDT